METGIKIDKSSFDENGYGIAPSVFSPSEVAELRAKAYKQFEIDKTKNLTYNFPRVKAKFAKGDLLSKELLHTVLLDERLLAIARTVLGTNDLVYFGDSSYQIGTGSNGFHRDNIDRTDLNGPDWKGKYTLLRMGLYLQDHSRYSGGLKIRKGSHKSAGGPAIFVDSRVGDVVFWDLKTLHSGNAVRLKGMPGFSINIAVAERNVPGFLRMDEEQERISMFMTFASKSRHLHRYLTQYTLKREDTKEHARHSAYADAALALAASRHVKVVKPLADQQFINELEHLPV